MATPNKGRKRKKPQQRRICFIITSGIHYARNKLVLEALRTRKDVDLQIVIGASALLSRYGDLFSVMRRDGFIPSAKITMVVEGNSPVAMAKTVGLGVIEFATVFENLQPDVVVVRGDRFEVLSATVAAVNLNIPVAHIEGGDISGTIDESIRHAITKLSHFHFATNRESKRRILRMGENPAYVFDVGSPELEYIKKNHFKITSDDINAIGVGDQIDLSKPYLLVLHHPVTTEYGSNRAHTEELLHAIRELGMQTIWFWPNVDAGTDEISKAIRVFREAHRPSHMHFLKYLDPEKFYGLLRNAACLVGNSSAGIKEASYWGIPVVNLGSRQTGRSRGKHVLDLPHFEKRAIMEAVLKQQEHGPFPRSTLYMKPHTSKNIARILAQSPLYLQKKFYE